MDRLHRGREERVNVRVFVCVGERGVMENGAREEEVIV